jgi:hypothetical protein
VTGLPLKAVNNAIDKETVSEVPADGGGRLFDARALVSLSIERRLSDRIAPELRPSLRPRGTSSALLNSEWVRRCAG